MNCKQAVQSGGEAEEDLSFTMRAERSKSRHTEICDERERSKGKTESNYIGFILAAR